MSKMGEKLIEVLNLSRENKQKIEWILQTDVDSILVRAIREGWFSRVLRGLCY